MFFRVFNIGVAILFLIMVSLEPSRAWMFSHWEFTTPMLAILANFLVRLTPWKGDDAIVEIIIDYIKGEYQNENK